MIKICEFDLCGSEFSTRDGRKRYCNHSCAASDINRKRGKKLREPKEKRKSVVEKWLSGEYDGTTKHGLSQAIRNYLIEKAEYKCSVPECGWSGFNPVTGKSTLQIDHLDGNCMNNSIENLKVLCPNCHSLTPTYGALNKGNGRKFRYSVVV